MHDVAAIAARIAHGQFARRRQNICVVALRDHARAAVKLEENCQRDEHGKDQANQRVDFPEAEGKRHGARNETGDAGNRKVPFQRINRCFAPSE